MSGPAVGTCPRKSANTVIIIMGPAVKLCNDVMMYVCWYNGDNSVAVSIPNRRPNPNGNSCGNVQENGPEAGPCRTQWVSMLMQQYPRQLPM